MPTDENRIVIQMLGQFSISVNDQCLRLGDNNKANFLKLIQVIYLHHETGIAKRELIDHVFGYKELLDENNSLNNLLHQARTQLKKNGMPGKRYIEGKKGIYYPERLEDYTFSCDFTDFRNLVKKAHEAIAIEEKATLYDQACRLYHGELLPDFATENWVIIESIRLKESYEELVRFLSGFYREKQNYDRLCQLYAQAARIYPESGWQIQLIDALILKKQTKEAYELYNKTACYYLDELEVPLPDELVQCYARIYEELKVVSEDIEDIQADILKRDAALKSSEEPASRTGSYYCAYASFIDVYNVLRRNMARRGSSIFMMLCTLVDYEGKPIQNPEKLNARSEALKLALYEGLRQGDVFTKYSASQYLLLLIGTKKEDCSIIYQRLARKLKERTGPRAELRYRIVSLAEIPAVLGKTENVENV